MTLKLGIVGCGGMGFRHMQGISEVMRHSDIAKLEAICDLHEEAANHVANEAEKNNGYRPKIYTDFDSMISESGIDILDIVTDTKTHHAFAIKAMNKGISVLTEKPMGITLKACRKMKDVQEKNNVKLAVAENYRRDPMNRLVKALIDEGAIGDLQMVIDVSVSGGGYLMHGTGWRAKKSLAGSLILEQGVHTSDLILYFMGKAKTIYAKTGVLNPIRKTSGMLNEQLKKFYGHRVEDQLDNSESQIEIDAEDTAISVIEFENGSIGQMTMSSAASGYGFGNESIHGSKGTIKLPGSRNGKSPIILRDPKNPGEPPIEITGDKLLDLVPKWELDEITSLYFDNKKRLTSYKYDFEEIDRKLIAIEIHDLAKSIIDDSSPEVDSEVGMDALALAYGALESGESGETVNLKDIISGVTNSYQNIIDEEFNI
jgi:predicted dehydrogenase|tara:strand:- start:2542 stop:3828 length:1287 start_codon:yes stop_codon:yes gene_type:complete